MASVEQKGLAEDVKSVHRKLREQLLEGGDPNEVMLISITGTSDYAFLLRFGRNICKIRRLWTSTAKAWNLWQLFIGNRAARKAGWIGSRIRYYSSILVTWPRFQILQAWVEWVKKRVFFKYPCHLSRYFKSHSLLLGAIVLIGMKYEL